MSVLVTLTWSPGESITEDAYWTVSDQLGIRDSLPAGCTSHAVAGDTASGFTISEVWDSAEQFGAWLEGSVGPATAQHGIPGPASVTVLPLVRHTAA